MYGAGIAFVTTMVVSNGIGAEGWASFFRLMALFAIAISLVTFGADTGPSSYDERSACAGSLRRVAAADPARSDSSLVTSVLLVAVCTSHRGYADGS